MDIKKRDDKYNIRIEPVGLCQRNNEIWFMQQLSNKLLCVEADTFELKEMVELSIDSNLYNRPPYLDRIISLEDRLIIYIYGTQFLYEYFVDEKKLQKINIFSDEKAFVCKAIYRWNDSLIFFPNGGENIFRYDYKNGFVEMKELERKIYCERDYIYSDHEIIFADSSGNVLHIYDLEKKEMFDIEEGDTRHRFFGIFENEDYLCLPSINLNEIMLKEKATQVTTYLKDFPKEYASIPGYAILNVYTCDDFFYIFPLMANMIIRINTKTKKIEPCFDNLYDIQGYEKTMRTYPKFTNTILINHYVYALSLDDLRWCRFDLHKNEWSSQKMIIRDLNIINNLRKIVNDEQNVIITEGYGSYTLKNFVYSIVDNEE